MIEQRVTLTEGYIDPGIFLNLVKTRLTPHALGEIFPKYNSFHQSDLFAPQIWLKEGTEIKSSRKFVIAFVGPSAGGKDAVIDLLNKNEQVRHTISAPWTTTTREKRSDVEKQHFLTKEAFKAGIVDGQFIEYIVQGGNYYGTKKSSIDDALLQEQPIIMWRGDLEGTQNMRQWMNSAHPDVPFFTIFMLPEISFMRLGQRIIEQRDFDAAMSWRIAKAFREIEFAPQLAQVLLLNPMEKDKTPHTATKALVDFLQRLVT